MRSRKRKKKNMNPIKLIALSFLGLGALVLGLNSYEIVDTGYRGVQTRFGEVVGEPLPEGLHFLNPFTTKIKEITVREEKFEGVTPVFTKDTQNASLSFTVTWYPNPKMVHILYKEIGDSEAVAEKILKPLVLASMKDATGQIIADDLINSREKATQQALATIRTNLAERPIVVTDLQFTNIDFDDTYEQAVENKVVAIQEAQKAKNETVKFQEQAKQVVLKAEAEAKSMQIKSEALSKNKGLVEFELATRWNGQLPSVIMGSGGNSILNMSDLLKGGK